MESEEVNRVDMSLDEIIKMDGLSQQTDRNTNRGGGSNTTNNNRAGNNNRPGGSNNRGGNNNNRRLNNNNNNTGGNNNNNRRLNNNNNTGGINSNNRGLNNTTGGNNNNNRRLNNTGGISNNNRRLNNNNNSMNRRGNNSSSMKRGNHNMTGGNGTNMNRGGTHSNSWGNNLRRLGMGQSRGQGQGGQGHVYSARRGGSSMGSGISPLNREKLDVDSESVVSAMSARSLSARLTGQQSDVRRWGANQGGMLRNGGVSVVQTRLGQFNNIRGSRIGLGNRLAFQRGMQGRLLGPLQRHNITVSQGGLSQGQGQGLVQVNQLTMEQKRELAVHALREARLTIAQLDQQTARQNLFNARRGILPEDTQQMSYTMNNQQQMYASMTSLSSAFSEGSAGRQLQGTQITSFRSGKPQQDRQGQRRWQQQKDPTLTRSSSTSTLTISIDNPAPIRPNSTTPHTDVPASRQHRQHHHHHQQQRRQQPGHGDRKSSSIEELELRRGATPGFCQQLAQLKPSVSMKYVFQKKAFSTASTPVSLNDRFSDPSTEDLLDRKVFM